MDFIPILQRMKQTANPQQVIDRLAVGTGQPTPSRMLREPPRPAWERLLGLRASKEWSARFGTLERARQPMI